MFKLSRKTIINVTLVVCSTLLVSSTLTCFRNPAKTALKPQFSLLRLLKRELSGIIFYHRNMVRAEKLGVESGALRWQLFNLREVNQENVRLKNLLNFKQKSLLHLVPARVIARSLDAWSSTIIIDKGKNNMINEGMAVISFQGLVGRVIESADNSSKVLLISDANQGIFGIVQRSRQEGLVNGTLGPNLIMRYLPEDAQIVEGDIIVTSELSRIYPKGLLIGKVIDIGRDFSGLNRFAIIKPAAQLASIEEVLVILP